MSLLIPNTVASNFLTTSEEGLLVALPVELREICWAIYNKVQSPPDLIFTSVLNALSSAVHGYVDVCNLQGGIQPTSLFTLVIAESGERKTSTDNLVMSSFVKREVEIQKHLAELKREREVEDRVWDARKRKLERDLNKAVKEEDDLLIASISEKLKQLLGEQPQEPKTSQQLFSDITAAAFIQKLAGERKALTLHTSEGGSLLKQTNVDFISVANQLWDGVERVTVSRKTSGDFVINSGRLSSALMLQPVILEQISKRKGEALRFSGYFARMLVTRPESTQGYRFASSPSEVDERHLEAFHQQLGFLIKQSEHYQSINQRVTLQLTPEARAYFVRLYNDVEHNLRDGGGFVDVRDAASKTVNNALRIAALLHVYKYGVVSDIAGDIAQSASHLAWWYLGEFQRVFGQKSVREQGKEYALLLEQWLRKNSFWGGEFDFTKLLRYGPNAIRKKDKMELAVGCLSEEGKVDYYWNVRPAYIVDRIRR